MVKRLLLRIVLIGLMLIATACNNQDGKTVRYLGVADDCDASQSSCQISDGAVTVSLDMGPEVKPLQSFPLILTIEAGGHALENVLVDFQMQGMEMGSNRYRLVHQGEHWAGSVIIPVCSASRVDWHAIVEFTVDGETVRAVFPFHTER